MSPIPTAKGHNLHREIVLRFGRRGEGAREAAAVPGRPWGVSPVSLPAPDMNELAGITQPWGVAAFGERRLARRAQIEKAMASATGMIPDSRAGVKYCPHCWAATYR